MVTEWDYVLPDEKWDSVTEQRVFGKFLSFLFQIKAFGEEIVLEVANVIHLYTDNFRVDGIIGFGFFCGKLGVSLLAS